MPRPIEGFCTSDGKFFEKETAAGFYEASLLLNEVLLKYDKLINPQIIIDALLKYPEEVKTFIAKYEALEKDEQLELL